MIDEDRKAAIKMLVNAYYRSDVQHSMSLYEYLKQTQKVSEKMTDEEVQYGIAYALGEEDVTSS